MTDTTITNSTSSAPAPPPAEGDAVQAIVRLARSTQIDIDSLDPTWARTLLTLGVTPQDQTSNQVLIVQALLDGANLPLLRETIASLAAEGRSDFEAVLDRFSVALCKRNDELGIIPGRFLLQTSPRYASDSAEIERHARNYASEFERVGLGKDRFCIKVPATGAGMTAAAALYADGIRTLGTSLFSVPQALAAAQAHCLSISPYFNEIPAHDRSPSRAPWPADAHAWPDVQHPATEHPMAPRMWQIVELYRRLGARARAGTPPPQIKAASMIGPLECLALGEEMRCGALTILAPVLKALVELRVSPEPQGKGEENAHFAAQLARGLAQRDALSPAGKPHPHYLLDADALDRDMLAHGGAELDRIIAEEDPETARRIQDSLDLFLKAEEVAREGVERVLAGKSLEGLVFGGL